MNSAHLKRYWPTLARVAGFLLGFGSIVAWPLTGSPPDGGVMTWAAALIVLPNVQAKYQNGQRASREAVKKESSA